jgi:antitoxin CptB
MKLGVIDPVEKNRLRWSCRRGLLELDLVLERFLGRDENLQASVVSSLHEILELPDNDLWDIVIGRSDRYAPHLNEIVARLRAA